jgi:hypothetical protein
MEKKEREQLKERLLKMVVNEPRPESMPPMTMAEVMVNSMSKPNLKPLLNFIEKELDKAREEVMFTEDEQRVLRFALKLQRDDIHKVWDEETFGTIWKKVGGLS